MELLRTANIYSCLDHVSSTDRLPTTYRPVDRWTVLFRRDGVRLKGRYPTPQGAVSDWTDRPAN